MRPLTIACLLAATTIAGAQQRSPARVIRDEGALMLFDAGNASYYRFNRDSTFDSRPVGLSGRTIRGRWRPDGNGSFLVEGLWGWVNGQNLGDDYRRMTMVIGDIDGVQTLPLAGNRGSMRFHKCSFAIDELVRIPPPESWGRRLSPPRTASQGLRLSTNHLPGIEIVEWTIEDKRCVLRIEYLATHAAVVTTPTQVWVLRDDGTVIAPTRAAVVTGVGFAGAGPPLVSYDYDRSVERKAVAVVVRIGNEYITGTLRR